MLDSKLANLEYPEDGPQTDLHSVTCTKCPISLPGLLWGTSHQLGPPKLEAQVVDLLLFCALRWGCVFFKSRLQNDVRRFGRGLAGLFSQQILLNLIKRCSYQLDEIFMNETNMRRFESVFTNRISSS